MNKAELIDYMLSEKDTPFCSKAHAEKSLNTILDGIRKGLKKYKTVQLVGFGTWNVRNRKARTGRNPQTGDTIHIKASRTVGFKCGKAWKEML